MINSGKRYLNVIILILLALIIILCNISLIYFYYIFLSANPANTNLIANPSFESGSIEPFNWTFVTNDGNKPKWDNIHHSGKKSIKITVSGINSGESGYLESDLIIAKPNKYYNFSAWGKIENISYSHWPAVRIVELDTNMNWLRQSNLIFNEGMNNWIQKSVYIDTSSNTAYLYVYANIWKGNGTFWVDDLSLSLRNAEPPPTPASVSVSTHTPVSTFRIYYVSIYGNDNNPGTEEQPWQTITKAANVVHGGDTVYVKEGTYNEKILINNSGSPGNYINFAAYPGDTVIIDGKGISVGMWDGLVQIYGSSYVTFSGFTIINSKFIGIMVSQDYETNIIPSNILIERNHISNIASSAILIEDGKDIIIDRNEISEAQTMEGLSQQTGETISLVNVDGFEIKNNVIYRNNFESINIKNGSINGQIHHNDISQHESAGIYIDAWSGKSSNIKIFSNKVHDGRLSGRGIALAVENGGSLKNINVYNNLIYRNAATGIDISWYSKGIVDNISIIGNTVYNNGLADSWGGGISADYGLSTNVIIRNNIVSKNNHYSIQVKIPGIIIDHNLIEDFMGRKNETKGKNYVEADPEFVDPSNADFHLRSTSPAIDKGWTDIVLIKDFEGNIRPINGSYDIGAFEHVSG
ncbi:MAG: right-handed parallel beta-helix repeat-containing protein [Candidatus Methanoperedens sp.]|nr:right-handed parallel beta-helix repeat-containing protein [Candidatus Methanoperedens sp.]